MMAAGGKCPHHLLQKNDLLHVIGICSAHTGLIQLHSLVISLSDLQRREEEKHKLLENLQFAISDNRNKLAMKRECYRPLIS